MPMKSIIEVDVEDSKFREFQRNFDQYHEALKNSSSPWAEIAKGTSDAAEALDKMVARERDANAVARLTALAKGRALDLDKEEAAARARAEYAALSRMEKLGKGAQNFAARMSGAVTHWKSVTGQAKETEARVASVTRLMSGWKALSLIGGLGGVGGSLYGLDRLAGSAAAGRRQSMGTGVPFGKQRAFSLDYSRFGDGDALMGAIGTAKGDATSQQYLGLLSAGISAAEIRAKDAADLGAELFDKLPGLFPRGANDPTFGSSFEARGLGSLLSQEDAKRYLNASPEERQAQRKAYEADSRSMAADPTSLRAWADLDSALGRAKDSIETALVKGLAPLAPQFTTLSGNIATLITDFAKSPEIKSDLDSLASGLGALDKALKDPDSWWNRSGRAIDTFSKAEQSWGHATHDWLHRHAPWATVDHYTGADNPYTGPNADLNRARLRGRSAVDEPEDRKRRAGDKLNAFRRGTMGQAEGGMTAASKDLSPEGRALLDTLASGEAKDYNVLNGGGTFSDMSHHPGGRAAGRYQFLPSTWDEVQGATGAKDFGPEAQDKGAWWLAQRDYKKRTGRDLQSDLASKDPATIAGIGRALSPTWVSLNNQFGAKYDRFLQRQSTAAPAISDVKPDAAGWMAGDLSGQSAYHHGQLDAVKGFIVHHTAGRGTPEGVVQTLNQRGLGVQYVMDRDGKIYQTLPNGARGAHIRHSEINELDNSNSLGMEVIAKDDSDVTPAQIASGKVFLDAMSKKYPGLQVFGHGEVSSEKQPTEGHAIVAAFRAGRLAPATDPNYKPPPTPMAQRTLQGYMGRDLPKPPQSYQSPVQFTKGGGANALTALYGAGFGDKMHREIAKAYLGNPALERARREGPAAGGNGGTPSEGLGLDKLQRGDPRHRIDIRNSTGNDIHVSAIGGAFG